MTQRALQPSRGFPPTPSLNHRETAAQGGGWTSLRLQSCTLRSHTGDSGRGEGSGGAPNRPGICRAPSPGAPGQTTAQPPACPRSSSSQILSQSQQENRKAEPGGPLRPDSEWRSVSLPCQALRGHRLAQGYLVSSQGTQPGPGIPPTPRSPSPFEPKLSGGARKSGYPQPYSIS